MNLKPEHFLVSYVNRDMWTYQAGTNYHEIWINDTDYNAFIKNLMSVFAAYSDFEYFTIGKIPGYAECTGIDGQRIGKTLFRAVLVFQADSLQKPDLKVNDVLMIDGDSDLQNCFIRITSTDNFHLLNTGALININLQSGNDSRYSDSIAYIKTDSIYQKQIESLEKIGFENDLIKIHESYAKAIYTLFNTTQERNPNLSSLADLQFVFEKIIRASQQGDIQLIAPENGLLRNVKLDLNNSCYTKPYNIMGYLQGYFKGAFTNIMTRYNEKQNFIQVDLMDYDLPYQTIDASVYERCLPYRNMWKLKPEETTQIVEKYVNFDNAQGFIDTLQKELSLNNKIEIASGAKMRNYFSNNTLYHALMVESGDDGKVELSKKQSPAMNSLHIAGVSAGESYYLLKSPYYVNIRMDNMNFSLASIETSRNLSRQMCYIEINDHSAEGLMNYMFSQYSETLMSIAKKLIQDGNLIKPLHCSVLNLILNRILKANHQYFTKINYTCGNCGNNKDPNHRVVFPITCEYILEESPFGFSSFFKTQNTQLPQTIEGFRKSNSCVLIGYTENMIMNNILETPFDFAKVNLTETYTTLGNGKTKVTLVWAQNGGIN